MVIELLFDCVSHDNLYAKLDCLSFMLEQESIDGYDITVRETHGGSCPGDPNTAPAIDRYQVKSDETILWLNNTISEYVYMSKVRTHDAYLLTSGPSSLPRSSSITPSFGTWA